MKNDIEIIIMFIWVYSRIDEPKMATLEEILQDLKVQVQEGRGKQSRNGKMYAERVLRIPGIKRLTLRVSYASDGHYTMIIYRGKNMKRQVTIFPEDDEELAILAQFLSNQKGVLSKYIKYGIPGKNFNNVITVDFAPKGGNDHDTKKTTSSKKHPSPEIEDEPNDEEDYEEENGEE